VGDSPSCGHGANQGSREAAVDDMIDEAFVLCAWAGVRAASRYGLPVQSVCVLLTATTTLQYGKLVQQQFLLTPLHPLLYLYQYLLSFVSPISLLCALCKLCELGVLCVLCELGVCSTKPDCTTQPAENAENAENADSLPTPTSHLTLRTHPTLYGPERLHSSRSQASPVTSISAGVRPPLCHNPPQSRTRAALSAHCYRAVFCIARR